MNVILFYGKNLSFLTIYMLYTWWSIGRHSTRNGDIMILVGRGVQYKCAVTVCLPFKQTVERVHVFLISNCLLFNILYMIFD